MLSEFEERGYLGPLSILSSEQCRSLVGAFRQPNFPPPLDWTKGHAVTSRAIYDIAVTPAILDLVEQILGRDVVLWGASILLRGPGQVHPWHSDIESSADGVRGVSVWVGLEHTSADSSLQVVSRSHRFGCMLQDARQQRNLGRDETSTENVLSWARELDPRSEFVKPGMTDGQAIFFDGRLWHYSDNRSPHTRVALLLQYATATSPVRIPNYSYLDRPFRNLTLPHPPCLLVRGDAPSGVNHIVQAPPGPAIGTEACIRSNRIYDLGLPLPTNPQIGFRPFPIFRGQTSDLRTINCHVSSLIPGSCPHPPHQHPDEEILLVLQGEVEIILPDLPASENSGSPGSQMHPHLAGAAGACRKKLQRGEFVYYPVGFTHTLISVGQEPANYLMFKWIADPTHCSEPLGFGLFHALRPHSSEEPCRQYLPSFVFEGPTACLRKLHCHISNVAPGKGYPPHFDSYDVAIVLLEGELETAGVRVGANTVIYHPAGEAHGLHNPGTVPARYIVFEFHGSQRAALNQPSPAVAAPAAPVAAAAAPVAVHTPAVPVVPPPSFLSKVRDPERWKRKLRHWGRKIIG